MHLFILSSCKCHSECYVKDFHVILCCLAIPQEITSVHVFVGPKETMYAIVSKEGVCVSIEIPLR